MYGTLTAVSGLVFYDKKFFGVIFIAYSFARSKLLCIFQSLELCMIHLLVSVYKSLPAYFGLLLELVLSQFGTISGAAMYMVV